MRPDRICPHLLLALAAVGLQSCYQDSPSSTPRHAIESLVILLADQDWVVRRTAAEALGKIGDSSKADNLLPVLGDGSPDVREAAARSLGRLEPMGTEKAYRLVDMLKDPSSAVRKAAASSLAVSEVGPEVGSRIVSSLSHDNVEVQAAAVSALLGMELSEGYEELLRAAVKGEAHVRQTAVAALGDWDDERVVAMLLDRLRHDGDAGVRAEAAYRLGFHAEEAVIAGLVEAAEQDASAQVRRWAQQSLAGLRR